MSLATVGMDQALVPSSHHVHIYICQQLVQWLFRTASSPRLLSNTPPVRAVDCLPPSDSPSARAVDHLTPYPELSPFRLSSNPTQPRSASQLQLRPSVLWSCTTTLVPFRSIVLPQESSHCDPPPPPPPLLPPIDPLPGPFTNWCPKETASTCPPTCSTASAGRAL